ncbi:carboxypeptidase-like regulatory domain-containing protein [Pseudonocardia sp. TRM90224]|uniref:carboxypeptidase-like regulatory domain-containing protein n=1 Tax=Pseudonocardia sp. TRM90224 TaxID=2812678 RepID=UPI001E4BC940|nr:carboxypeptidase-like regulatory domain-containing protein [Pseudonocardia sp. TRM90224]
MTHPGDDDLIERLRRIAAEADPPPGIVGAAARAALATRRLDDELAELVLDSAHEPELVRAAGDDVRMLTFEAGDVAVELQVQAQLHEAGRLAMRGLVTGPVAGLTVETPGGERTADLDADGWFAVEDLPPGPTRLRLTRPDAPAVTSAWIAL